MSQTSLDFRSISYDSRNCALPLQKDKFEFVDDSLSDSGFGSFQSDNYLKEFTFSGCDDVSDNDCLAHSHFSLSTKVRDKCKLSNSDLDVNLLDLLNAVNTGKGGSDHCLETNSSVKGSPFSDCTLKSFCSSSDNEMKIVSDKELQVTDDFSDLLSSLSLTESNFCGFNDSPSCLKSDSNVCIDDLRIPYLNEFCNFEKDGKDKKLSGLQVEENLSDMLFSISIEDCNKSTPDRVNEAASSLASSYDEKDYNESNEISLADLAETGYFANTTNEVGTVNETGDFSCLGGRFSIFHNLPKSCSADHEHVNNPSVQVETTDYCELSLLDLMKAVNYKKPASDNLSVIENNLNGPEDSQVDNIDLSVCIKTSLNTPVASSLSLKPTVNGDNSNGNTNLSIQSSSEYIDFPVSQIILSGQINCMSSATPRANLKQSLFAKALSCKPKKNRSMLQKVTSIKSEMFMNLFDHPVLETRPCPENEKVFRSNTCFLTSVGRRLFGTTSCELI